MASESKTVTVIPPNGSNYPTWKVQCRMALMKDGLWSIVSGSERRPDVAEPDKYAKFVARRDRALAVIVLSVEPSLLDLIGDPEDPIIVWQKLADQFQKKTWANKLELRFKLYALRLRDGDSVQEHIKAMTEVFDALSVVGDPVPEEDRVVHLLASLPESYVLVKAPCECTTGIIERGLRASCVIDSRDRKPRSIIPVVYERERCFNWFVARFEPVKQEKARGNDGLRTAVHARILQRAVMADALAENLGAVASELLLATENAADDPNFSISPENCARYGIYCTVVRGMAFIVLSAPLIRPRIVLQSMLVTALETNAEVPKMEAERSRW